MVCAAAVLVLNSPWYAPTRAFGANSSLISQDPAACRILPRTNSAAPTISSAMAAARLGSSDSQKAARNALVYLRATAALGSVDIRLATGTC